jgi:ribonucleoside-diphosphate reductase alpha chain
MNNFEWLNSNSIKFLHNGYIDKNQDPKERILEICKTAESILGIPGYANKLYDYCSRGWVSFSSPVWSNFGKRALSISCFNSVCDDTMESILYKNSEIGMMSKHGGGTSLFLGHLRERGAKISSGGFSDGPVHFAKITDSIVTVCKQSEVRRGSCAVYLPFEHPDILEFLEIGSDGHPIQNLQFGITITSESMSKIEAGDKHLRKIWAKVLESRLHRGFPYVLYIDNINDNSPEVYKENNLKIVSSQLCTEIMLSSSPTESFVCDLSSVNIVYYEDWKDTDLVETMIFLLDAVMTDFINKARQIPYFEHAVSFAEKQRALGLGVLGWHSYLQSKMIPIESVMARSINKLIFKRLQEQSIDASAKLAKMYGVPMLLQGHNRRNATVNAIAPTKSSSYILGQVSLGIEPYKSNYFIKDVAKVKEVFKNKYLEALLESKGKNDKETWDSILKKDG